MIDELTIYNLVAKYPTTVDLIREVEKMVRAEAFDEFVEKYKEFQDMPCDAGCDAGGECPDCFAKWYKEQKNGNENGKLYELRT